MPLLLAAEVAHTGSLTALLLEFARGGGEWVLWLLILLSVGTFFIAFERILFLRSHTVEVASLRTLIMERLNAGDRDGLLGSLKDQTSMAARVLANGLRDADRGPEAVAELCHGAIGIEKLRYERGINYLATVGSNAPFIGLFGTVMGVIMAFDQLRSMGGAGGAPNDRVMGAIAEALIATGVGLLVAIPSIIFFNLIKARIKRETTGTQLLVDTLVAYLRSESK